jgi:NADH dehydrogenase [ubiquinone] 1 alpha subcomplex assembly factor 5
MIGGETLFELRTSLQLADQERTGGIGAHVSPMVGQSALSATQICRKHQQWEEP